MAGVVPRLSVHEQAGGVFSDGWELELWRTTGRIEDTWHWHKTASEGATERIGDVQYRWGVLLGGSVKLR